MKHLHYLIVVGTLAAAWTPLGVAHHSTPANFVVDENVTLDGIVTQFYWRNPHAFIFMAITNDAGETEEWHVEMSNTIGLTRRGWTPETLQPGDVLTVIGNPARDPARRMVHIQSMTRASDGFAY